MNYKVTWLPKALNSLADIWTNAAERRPVTDAANRLDQALAVHPMTLGESRDTLYTRVASEGLLNIGFEVREAENRVYVLNVSSKRR